MVGAPGTARLGLVGPLQGMQDMVSPDLVNYNYSLG